MKPCITHLCGKGTVAHGIQTTFDRLHQIEVRELTVGFRHTVVMV